MSFKLSPEQLEFKDSLRSFLREHVPVANLRERISAKVFSDNGLWQKYLELGLMDFFACQEGESISQGLDLFYIAFECGYSLEPEGLWESILAGPFLFKQLLRDDSVDIPDLRHARFLLACWPSHNKINLDKELSLHTSQSISGRASFLLGDPGGRYLVCSQGTAKGDPSLCFLDLEKNRPHIRFEVLQNIDATRALMRIHFDKSPVVLLAPHATAPLLQLYRVLKAGEIAGACTRALEMTTEHVKTRRQFGVPLGGFQAVQHRLADMFLHTESMRALCQFAAWAVQDSPSQAELACRAALAHAVEVGPLVVESAIQLHGGIGFTWEFDLHFYLKRVKSLQLLFNSDADTHELVAVASAQHSEEAPGGTP